MDSFKRLPLVESTIDYSALTPVPTPDCVADDGITERLEQLIAEYWLMRDSLYPCLDPVEIVTMIRRLGCEFETPEPYSPHNTCNS